MTFESTLVHQYGKLPNVDATPVHVGKKIRSTANGTRFSKTPIKDASK